LRASHEEKVVAEASKNGRLGIIELMHMGLYSARFVFFTTIEQSLS